MDEVPLPKSKTIASDDTFQHFAGVAAEANILPSCSTNLAGEALSKEKKEQKSKAIYRNDDVYQGEAISPRGSSTGDFDRYPLTTLLAMRPLPSRKGTISHLRNMPPQDSCERRGRFLVWPSTLPVIIESNEEVSEVSEVDDDN